MIHHVEIYVSDLGASRRFWTGLLRHVGFFERSRWEGGFTLACDSGGGYLTLVQVSPQHAGHPYHRCAVGLNHLAFAAGGRKNVDRIRRYCLDEGVRLLYDDRYPFANGAPDYYAVFLEDPDRIKVEFVA